MISEHRLSMHVSRGSQRPSIGDPLFKLGAGPYFPYWGAPSNSAIFPAHGDAPGHDRNTAGVREPEHATEGPARESRKPEHPRGPLSEHRSRNIAAGTSAHFVIDTASLAPTATTTATATTATTTT
jgi:hypothetical protein